MDGDTLRSAIASPVNRRRFLGGSSAVAAAALLAACGTRSGGSGSSGGGSNGDYVSHPKWKFAFINHVTTNSFFVPTQYGAADACALVDCQYTWGGSETSNVTQMVDAMKTAIAAKVDGIAVSLIDNTAFNDLTSQAISQGIPVVSYNADSTTNARLAYIGQDLTLAGQQMGQRIVSEVDSGLVAGFIATPGSANIQPRINGALQVIQASGKNIQFTQVATGAETPAEQTAIESWYLGHKNCAGMFAVDGGSTQGVAAISKKYGLAAKGVKTGGFDLLPETLKLIQSGDLGFTIDQQAYLQGFFPVLELFLYKMSGSLTGPSEIDTGLKFITKANVGPYNRSTSRFEGSTKQQKLLQAS